MNDTQKWIVFLLGLFVIYKVLDKIGLVDNLKERRQEQKTEGLQIIDALDPKYYSELQKKGKVQLTTIKFADELAKQIFDAKGYVYDTDGEALSAFRKLKSKSQVSFVAKRFAEIYKRDLGEYLDFMSDKNMAILYDTIRQMPTGLIKK